MAFKSVTIWEPTYDKWVLIAKRLKAQQPDRFKDLSFAEVAETITKYYADRTAIPEVKKEKT